MHSACLWKSGRHHQTRTWHAVPALLAQLPNFGRGCRVARRKHPEGTFFHIVDLEPKKAAMTARLNPALATGADLSDAAETEVGSSARRHEAAAAAEGMDPGEAGLAPASGDAADAQRGEVGAEERQYVGPSGFTVKRREFSAHVYGVKFRRDQPETGRVQRVRHAYKREWLLRNSAGTGGATSGQTGGVAPGG